MANKPIAKQMIQLNQAVFDNSFRAMNKVVEQNEKMIETFFLSGRMAAGRGRRGHKKIVVRLSHRPQ